MSLSASFIFAPYSISIKSSLGRKFKSNTTVVVVRHWHPVSVFAMQCSLSRRRSECFHDIYLPGRDHWNWIACVQVHVEARFELNWLGLAIGKIHETAISCRGAGPSERGLWENMAPVGTFSSLKCRADWVCQSRWMGNESSWRVLWILRWSCEHFYDSAGKQ